MSVWNAPLCKKHWDHVHQCATVTATNAPIRKPRNARWLGTQHFTATPPLQFVAKLFHNTLQQHYSIRLYKKKIYSKHFSRLYNTPPHKVTTTPPPHKITNTANQHQHTSKTPPQRPNHHSQLWSPKATTRKPQKNLEFSTHRGHWHIRGTIWANLG